MNFSNLKNITILNPFKMDILDKRGGGGYSFSLLYGFDNIYQIIFSLSFPVL